jgi:hypothetical protein
LRKFFKESLFNPLSETNSAKSLDSSLRIKEYPSEKLNVESNDGKSVKVEAHNKEGGIHLIGWEWDKNKNQWLFCLFLLIAAIAKIGYHYSHFLSSYVPESWYENVILSFNIMAFK